FIKRVFAIAGNDLTANLLGEVIRSKQVGSTTARVDAERLGLRLLSLFSRDEAVRRHLVDHPVATLDCALFVSIRMVVRRTLRQSGQVSGFRNGEVVDRFVEIAECSASNTEGAHTEPNFVEIKLENTVFRIGLL